MLTTVPSRAPNPPSLPSLGAAQSARQTHGRSTASGREQQRLGTERLPAPRAFVPTRTFLRAPEDSPNTTHGHHWFGNAESYFLIGDAMGRALVELLER